MNYLQAFISGTLTGLASILLVYIFDDTLSVVTAPIFLITPIAIGLAATFISKKHSAKGPPE